MCLFRSKRIASALLTLADTAGLPTAKEQRIGDLLRRVESVAASGISLSVRTQDGPEPYSALTDLLIEIGRAATKCHAVVMIHIDEVQNITDEHARSQLLIALGDALNHEEPIYDLSFHRQHGYGQDFACGVDVYINFLRAKIDKGYDQKIIKTVRSVGYIVKE